VLPPSKISSSCRSDYLYVTSFFVAIVTTDFWTKQAQSIHWTQGLFMPFWKCHFPSNTKYSVFILYTIGSQSAPYGAPGLRERNLGVPRAIRSLIKILTWLILQLSEEAITALIKFDTGSVEMWQHGGNWNMALFISSR